MPTQSSRIVAGRYRLVRELGSGGMGTVWLAADELLDREVAVKEVSPPLDVTEPERAVLRERTLREARTAARLSHPNVVTIYDVVEDGGRPWIVMELVPARSLRDIVAEDGPLTPQRAAEVGRQVLAALGAAHSLGIMHRDVKPGNVLIDAGGRAVLADFGIARTQDSPTLTTSGVLVGSPSYIAPERARGERGGPESDLWSLGATLYAAVEGRPPYDRNGALATLTAVVTEEPDAPRRCGVLWPVISGLLARDPARRIGPAEAGEMLRQVAGNGPGPQRTGPGPGPATAPMPGVLSRDFRDVRDVRDFRGHRDRGAPAGTAAPEAADRSAAGSASTLQNAERTLAFHPRVPLLPPLDGTAGRRRTGTAGRRRTNRSVRAPGRRSPRPSSRSPSWRSRSWRSRSWRSRSWRSRSWPGNQGRLPHRRNGGPANWLREHYPYRPPSRSPGQKPGPRPDTSPSLRPRPPRRACRPTVEPTPSPDRVLPHQPTPRRRPGRSPEPRSMHSRPPGPGLNRDRAPPRSPPWRRRYL